MNSLGPNGPLFLPMPPGLAVVGMPDPMGQMFEIPAFPFMLDLQRGRRPSSFREMIRGSTRNAPVVSRRPRDSQPLSLGPADRDRALAGLTDPSSRFVFPSDWDIEAAVDADCCKPFTVHSLSLGKTATTRASDEGRDLSAPAQMQNRPSESEEVEAGDGDLADLFLPLSGNPAVQSDAHSTEREAVAHDSLSLVAAAAPGAMPSSTAAPGVESERRAAAPSMRHVEDMTRDARKQMERKRWAVSQRLDPALFSSIVARPAISYPFQLDVFQKEAIMHMERGESVFVAAHTSAGKTVVAEYAIALAQKHLTRAIYTSPIKTLSNQKYRDFKSKFSDVGILTGDVQINPTGSCLIMTTEILRSMLYRGADLIRDVEWVIFDEVHYVNDLERGVVWEEVFIMLPSHINLVLLSATVPNAFEFADWIGRTKKLPIHVISTFRRPVPLEHYLFYHGERFKIVDEHKQFQHTGYRAAVALYKSSHKDTGKSAGGGGLARAIHAKTGLSVGQSLGASGQHQRGGGGGLGGKSEWNKLLRMLHDRGELPAVVFAFSKKRCEEFCDLFRDADFTTGQEKAQIRTFFHGALARLQPADRELPQLKRLRDMLVRGIGVHHAGLLPLAKEIVEIMFSKGLCKILFATETFAMGVNMPTRTVVFSHIRKHDGKDFRYLAPGEYTQMSGRAGRRGLDNVGLVILFSDQDIPEEHVLQKMMLGQPARLVSQFRLSYNMILNLLRCEGFRVEDMMKRSFAEFDVQKDAPVVRIVLHELRLELERATKTFGTSEDDHVVSQVFDRLHTSMLLWKEMQTNVLRTQAASGLLLPGRIVLVASSEKSFDSRRAAAIIRTTSIGVSTARAGLRVVALAGPQFESLVSPVADASECPLSPAAAALLEDAPGRLDLEFFEIDLSRVVAIAAQRVNVSDAPQTGSSLLPVHKQKIVSSLRDMLRRTGGKFEVVDIVQETKTREFEVMDQYTRRAALLAAVKDLLRLVPPDREPRFRQRLEEYARLRWTQEQIQNLEQVLADRNLAHFSDFEARARILQRLKYISEDRSVLLKGRVACEINSCDCLVLTELIFDNFLTPLSPEQIICVLSALVCQDKDSGASEDVRYTPFMAAAREKLMDVVKRLAAVQSACELVSVSEEEYVRQTANFAMFEVAFEWAKGTSFTAICQLTSLLEGSIVRTITQLDQLCREVRDASRVIGDFVLFEKMQTCEMLIKRDIVFSASLYVVE